MSLGNGPAPRQTEGIASMAFQRVGLLPDC